jgi:hypothetical protein
VVVSHNAVNRQVLVAFDPGLGNPGTLPQDNGCFNTLDLRNDDSWTGRRSVRGPVLAGSAGRREHRTRSDHGGDRLTILGPAVGPLRFYAEDGAWPLASAGDSPAYAAVVLPVMLRVANALMQPSLFGCEPPAS